MPAAVKLTTPLLVRGVSPGYNCRSRDAERPKFGESPRPWPVWRPRASIRPLKTMMARLAGFGNTRFVGIDFVQRAVLRRA